MEENSDAQQKIEKIEAALSDLDHHRGQLLDELARLREELLQKNSSAQLKLHLQETSFNNQSPQVDKIRLFRSLFKGRGLFSSHQTWSSLDADHCYLPGGWTIR